MPRFVQTCYLGTLHHSIEYGPERSRHLGRPLGTVTASLKITDAEAARGIDTLVRENFPETVPSHVASYHGA